MPVSAETLRLLMDAGVEGDNLLRIVASIDADTSKPRSTGAERQARYRARKKAGSVTSDVTRDGGDVTRDASQGVTEVTPLARVEDNLQTKDTLEGNKKKKTARDDLADFRAELSVLDTERLDAIEKHRRSRKAPLTGHAARLFKADASAAKLTLSQAVDTCISRNWLTVKADWLTPRQNGPPGAQQQPNERQQLNSILDAMQGKSSEPARPSFDASDDSRDRRSAQGVVQFDAFAARGRP